MMKSIKTLLANLFHVEIKLKREPKIGEQWQYADDESPWPSRKYPPVKILDVRDGWVRYEMVAFPDNRLRMRTFLYCYRPVD